MPICEQARKNHDELFPGLTSQLAVADPELIEIFDNFVFAAATRRPGPTHTFDGAAGLNGLRAVDEVTTS